MFFFETIIFRFHVEFGGISACHVFQGTASVEQVNWMAPSAGALAGCSSDACVVGRGGSIFQNRGYVDVSRRVSA